MMRKIIQFHIHEAENVMYALCDDGTMWYRTIGTKMWRQVNTMVIDTAVV